MNEFIDKIGAFWIISQKLSEIQEDISQALEITSKDDNCKSSYWRQPHAWALSNIEVRIKEAKGITNSVLRKLKKEVNKSHEVSY